MMRSAANGNGAHGSDGGNSGPGPCMITITGQPLNPEHWWNRI